MGFNLAFKGLIMRNLVNDVAVGSKFFWHGTACRLVKSLATYRRIGESQCLIHLGDHLPGNTA